MTSRGGAARRARCVARGSRRPRRAPLRGEGRTRCAPALEDAFSRGPRGGGCHETRGNWRRRRRRLGGGARGVTPPTPSARRRAPRREGCHARRGGGREGRRPSATPRRGAYRTRTGIQSRETRLSASARVGERARSAAPTETERPCGAARTGDTFGVSSSDVVHPALVETPAGDRRHAGTRGARRLPASAFRTSRRRKVPAERGFETRPETFGPEIEPERERDLASALSRADAAEEKLRACESALRLAETAKADAETPPPATLVAESDRRETGTRGHRLGFEAGHPGGAAETRVAAQTETETKTARASGRRGSRARRGGVRDQTPRRRRARTRRCAGRGGERQENADATRAEAEQLLERAEISPEVTDEEETSYVSRVGDDENSRLFRGSSPSARLFRSQRRGAPSSSG